MSINEYLANNKGQVSDYHLIKDIVDRNTETKEDEINTMIPIPLYLGLIGTMICIFVGLQGLNLNSMVSGKGEDMIQGISPLLSGVAVAMITSIIGIFLTTIGSWLAKNAKIETESEQNAFLTWIQANLLPNLSNDTAQALQRMTQDLTSFNRTFSTNAKNLNEMFQQIHTVSQDQTDILNAMKRFKITEVVSANITIYDKLKNCTDEIGKLGEYLQEINKHQANTTEAIEKLNTFFDKGIEAIDEINLEVKDALERFKTNTKKYIKDLEEKLDSQILDIEAAAKKQQTALALALKTQSDELTKHFATVTAGIETAANKQQEIFEQKLKNLNTLVTELQNLSAVKSSLAELVKQSGVQSQQIAQLTRAIHELAEMKTTGGTMQTRLPQWLIIIIVVGGGLVSITCLAVLVPKIIELFNSL
jgi:DNA repair exonuclease SbcCD ATPase subunit